MSKFFIHILTSTTLISTLSVSAFAGSPMLEKADTNHDGLIQLSEFTTTADLKFTEIDADGNGLITKEERKAHRAQKGEARAKAKFARLDRNSDGSVSEAEFMAAKDARKERVMKRRDINGDGQVDQEDRDAHKSKLRTMHKEMRAHKRKHKGQHAENRPKIDTNGDGVVDLSEHQAAVLVRFERMDKNSDGVLSADEQRRPKGKRYVKK